MFRLRSVILHRLEWVYQKDPKSDINVYINVFSKKENLQIAYLDKKFVIFASHRLIYVYFFQHHRERIFPDLKYLKLHFHRVNEIAFPKNNRLIC